MIVSIIAALAEGSRAIGLRGQLPWHLPADLARFRQLTMGHAVIMGRLTWEPLAERGLPGRRMIILSRQQGSTTNGMEVESALSLEQALEIAARDPAESEAFVAGGAQVFGQALASGEVSRMYLTWVQAEVEADAFFPEFDRKGWTPVSVEDRAADQDNRYPMRFETLERSPTG